MSNKTTISQIIQTFESRWFMSVMSTGAIAILTQIIGKITKINILKTFSSYIGYLAIFMFLAVSLLFLIRLFFYKKEIVKDLKHPIAANFFAGINISLAVLTSVILNVLIPNHAVAHNIGINLATLFYFLALFISLLILILVPVILIISKEVITKHALGIWFLPPVGMFVVIFAGNFLALHGVLKIFIAHLNLFIFGVAFVLYFLILNLIYYRLKFHPLPAPEVAPSFVIGLAPIGVSVIAVKSFALLIGTLSSFVVGAGFLTELSNLYTITIYGFGFWWFSITLIILSYYIIKHSIPFTLGYWAFVFPMAAFGIGLKFLVSSPTFHFMLPVLFTVWVISVLLWIFVLGLTIKSIFNKKAFIRPDVIN